MMNQSEAAKHLNWLLIIVGCIGLLVAGCLPAVDQTKTPVAQHSAQVCLKSGPGEVESAPLALLAQARLQQAALTTAHEGFRYKP